VQITRPELQKFIFLCIAICVMNIKRKHLHTSLLAYVLLYQFNDNLKNTQVCVCVCVIVGGGRARVSISFTDCQTRSTACTHTNKHTHTHVNEMGTTTSPAFDNAIMWSWTITTLPLLKDSAVNCKQATTLYFVFQLQTEYMSHEAEVCLWVFTK
jgi:hypothetical protein